MDQKKIEQSALTVGIVVNLLMGGAGLWVYLSTGIKALFLDATFTLIAVLSGISAVWISRESKTTSNTFPNGLFILEPLYAILKSLLTLGLSFYTAAVTAQKAIAYFRFGTGEKMALGPVIPYEITMVILCIGLSVYYRFQNKRIGHISTMLVSETQSTLIDGLISGGIGIGALLISLIDESNPLYFLHYTGDFFITSFLMLISLKEPLKVLKESFIELANGVVTNEKIKNSVEQIIRKHLPADIGLKKYVIHKTGMSFRIAVSLEIRTDTVSMTELIEKINCIEKELSRHYEFVTVNFLFP